MQYNIIGQLRQSVIVNYQKLFYFDERAYNRHSGGRGTFKLADIQYWFSISLLYGAE
jgi:hypothetical protein